MHSAARLKTKFLLILLVGTFNLHILEISNSQEFPPTVCEEVTNIQQSKGRVVNEEGSPIKGAKIYATWGAHYSRDKLKTYGDFYGPAVSDENGNYTLAAPKRADMHVVVASGFAPQTAIPNPNQTVEVVVHKGRTISGKVVSPDGEPLVGASVQMVHWYVRKPSEQWTQVENDHQGYNKSRFAGLPDFGASAAVRTNNKGVFSLSNLPADHRLAIIVNAKGVADELVCVRRLIDGEDDEWERDFADQLLVSNNFSYTTKPASVLSLTGVDEEGNSVRIGAVTLQPKAKWSNVEHFRQNHTLNSESSFVNLTHFPDGFTAFIEPENNVELTGVRINFPSNAEGESFEQEVQFKTGFTIRGSVIDEKSLEGIPSVQIRWRSSDRTEHDFEGNLAPLNAKTDKGGTFEFAVPDSDGHIGVVGYIEGYRSVSTWADAFGRNPPDCIARYVRELESGDIESLPPLRFELLKNYQLNIKAIHPNGRPAANCKIMAEIAKPAVFNRPEKNRWFSQETNELGELKILNWYPDAGVLEQGIKYPTPIERLDPRFYPIQIRGQSDAGDVGGTLVPLPDPDDDSVEIDVTIKLKEPGSVQGQIINTAGEAIKDLKITASSTQRHSNNNGHEWTTFTRDDGRFLMTGIPVGVQTNWTLDSSRVKTAGYSNEIKIDLSQLKRNSILEIPAVTALDLTPLQSPLPELNLADLENIEALKTLTQFAVDQINKLPIGESDRSKFLMSRSSTDPIALFNTRLEKALIEKIDELTDRDTGGEFELKVLAAASSWYAQISNSPASERFNTGNQVSQHCLEQLMENHIDNENAQDILIALVESFQVRSHSFNQSTAVRWETLRDESQFERTKAIATAHLAVHNTILIGNKCMSNIPLKDFQDSLVELQQQVSATLNDNRDKAGKDNAKRLRDALTFLNSNLENQSTAKFAVGGTVIESDPIRREMITELIEEFVDSP